jgi:hypothetical protein
VALRLATYCEAPEATAHVDMHFMSAEELDADTLVMGAGDDDHDLDAAAAAPIGGSRRQMRQAAPLVAPLVPDDFVPNVDRSKGLCLVEECVGARARKSKYCIEHTRAANNVKRAYWNNGDLMDLPLGDTMEPYLFQGLPKVSLQIQISKIIYIYIYIYIKYKRLQ